MATRGPKIRFEVVDVTRQIASRWLGRNVERNRNPKPRQIKRYVADMTHKPSRWLVTGDTIKITADGDLIDGGQRMRAALAAFEADPTLKSVPMAVAFNVPYDAIYVTDKGAKRTMGDTLKIEEGVTEGNKAAAVLRRVWTWKQGNYADMTGSNVQFADPTDTELLEFFRKYRGEVEAATARGRDLGDKKIGNSTAAGAAFFLLREIDAAQAHDFFDHLITGANLPEKSPILMLRDRLMRSTLARGQQQAARVGDLRGSSLTSREQLHFYIRTWNAWRTDEVIDRLIVPAAGLTNKNFARPK